MGGSHLCLVVVLHVRATFPAGVLKHLNDEALKASFLDLLPFGLRKTYVI